MLQQATHYCDHCHQPVEAPHMEVSYGALKLRGNRMWHFTKTARLTASQAAILRALILRGIVSREGLLMRFGKEPGDVTDNLVSVHMTRLRRALERVDAPCHIVTQKGIGYSLEPKGAHQ